MTWIQTYSGRRFSLTEPSAEDVDIDDVAHETVRVTHSGREAQR